MYLAINLHKGQQKLDEDEFINIELIPIEDLVAQIINGTITDGKTQVSILKAEKILNTL